MRRALVLLCAALAGCTPELDDRAFLVDGPRLLAVASTPAEAAPSAAVTLRALYVDARGERTEGELDWAFCTARRALTDQGTVSPRCLEAQGESLVPFGAGASATGALPMEGCRLFGPDRPTPVDGEPAGRAVDPDPSGGYYQPVRLLVRDGGDRVVIGATRIACGIAGATAEVAADFGKRYRRNENPAVASVALVRDGVETTVDPSAPPAHLSRGERVTLRAAWPACPTEPACGDGVCGIDEEATSCAADCQSPRGCAGAETYLLFDQETRALATRREALRVSWFATGGALENDVVGRAAEEADIAQVENRWVAPAEDGPVALWLVIRDDRGGVGWATRQFVVGP